MVRTITSKIFHKEALVEVGVVRDIGFRNVHIIRCLSEAAMKTTQIKDKHKSLAHIQGNH